MLVGNDNFEFDVLDEEQDDEGAEETEGTGEEQEENPIELPYDIQQRVLKLEEDSQLLETLLENPQIRNIVLGNNEETGGNRSRTQEEEIDPQTDPIGAVRQMIDRSIAENTQTIVQSVTDRLMRELNPMISQSKQSSERAEYDAFTAAYPKAKAMTFEQVANIRASRPSLSIKEAVAITKPELLVGNTTSKIPPTVSRPTGRSGESESAWEATTPSRLKDLRERAQKSEGTVGIRSKISKVFSGK